MNAFSIGLIIFLGLLLLAALVLLVRPSRSKVDRARLEAVSAETEYRSGPRYVPPFGGS